MIAKLPTLQRVENWREGWKWGSVHFSVAGFAFNALVASLIKGVTVSALFLGYVSVSAFFWIAAGFSLATLACRFLQWRYHFDESDSAGR